MIQSEWANEWIHGNISTLRVITPEPRGVQLVSVMVRLLNWFEYHRRETSLKWSWEARKGSSHAYTTRSQYRPQQEMSLASAVGRDTILLLPAGTRKISSLSTAWPLRDCHNAANEKALSFKLPVSSKGLCIYNSLSQLPLLLCKSFLSFILLDLHWICHLCMSRVEILCCSWINSFDWLKTTTDCVIVLG